MAALGLDNPERSFAQARRVSTRAQLGLAHYDLFVSVFAHSAELHMHFMKGGHGLVRTEKPFFGGDKSSGGSTSNNLYDSMEIVFTGNLSPSMHP